MSWAEVILALSTTDPSTSCTSLIASSDGDLSEINIARFEGPFFSPENLADPFIMVKLWARVLHEISECVAVAILEGLAFFFLPPPPPVLVFCCGFASRGCELLASLPAWGASVEPSA
jgi:hypothetical protein